MYNFTNIHLAMTDDFALSSFSISHPYPQQKQTSLTLQKILENVVWRIF